VITVRIAAEKADMTLPVDATGDVYVPTAGAVQVSGVMLPVAEARVEQALRAKDRFAQVGLLLAEAGGHRATVLGAVERPGDVQLRPGTRIAEMLALGGGPKTKELDGELVDLADLEAARVVRNGLTLPISVARAIEGHPQHNVRVQPGDVIFVPPTRGARITVIGAAGRPKTVSFRRGLRLTEALAIGGGLSEAADHSDVRVIRGPLSKPRVYIANLYALRRGEGHDVVLEPGDVVFVTEHWFASVTQVLSRLTPFLAASALTVAVAK
jgi:polysaccharide biosynthesis/export protein